MKNGKHITLGIESSCDETAIGIVADGREVLANVISSQIDIHTAFGGVVPEIASRRHLENINGVLSQALEEAQITIDEVDLIGVTYGPGLVGALLVGVAAAKAISFAKDIPLVAVNHMHGHIAANYVEYPELEPPFMGLVVSGGHTNIVFVKDYNQCETLGETRDDAAGEAFDKVARVIGLGYPGGPKVDRAAKEGDPHAIEFKRVYLEPGSYDFSFSGLKTAALNHINSCRQAGNQCGGYGRQLPGSGGGSHREQSDIRSPGIRAGPNRYGRRRGLQLTPSGDDSGRRSEIRNSNNAAAAAVLHGQRRDDCMFRLLQNEERRICRSGSGCDSGLGILDYRYADNVGQ